MDSLTLSFDEFISIKVMLRAWVFHSRFSVLFSRGFVIQAGSQFRPLNSARRCRRRTRFLNKEIEKLEGELRALSHSDFSLKNISVLTNTI